MKSFDVNKGEYRTELIAQDSAPATVDISYNKLVITSSYLKETSIYLCNTKEIFNGVFE